MSQLIEAHQPCPKCGSSDARTEYIDHFYCFSCEAYASKGDDDGLVDTVSGDSTRPAAKSSTLKEVPTEGFKPLRGITADTMKRYGVWTEGDQQFYPYYKGPNHVANKIRTLSSKGFLASGDMARTSLFGQQLFPSGGKAVTVVEGELDALSAYQMFDSKYPVVSIKGASSAERDCTDNFEYLNSFEQIVLCFDRDEPHRRPDGTIWYPGQEAALRVAALFPLGKVRLLTLGDAKDANDYLVKGLEKKYQQEWWRAPVWTPVGIRLAKDMWDEVSTISETESIPYPWESLNAFTYGIRLSEVVLLTADTGVGKTSVVKEVEHYLLQHAEKSSIGILHLEEPNRDTLLGLMSITANKPLHLPDVRAEVSTDELRKYWEATCDTDRIVVWDHFGSNSIDGVLNTIRYMRNLGCKYIILDHLSIIVSDQSGDERKQLDEISTKIKTLCMELNIAVICVIHQNRAGEIRGSAGPEQIANMVFKLYRNKTDADEWRRNVTRLTVEKNRFCGRTGPACYLYYDPTTGRLNELTREQIARYESGAGTEEDFTTWEKQS